MYGLTHSLSNVLHANAVGYMVVTLPLFVWIKRWAQVHPHMEGCVYTESNRVAQILAKIHEKPYVTRLGIFLSVKQTTKTCGPSYLKAEGTEESVKQLRSNKK